MRSLIAILCLIAGIAVAVSFPSKAAAQTSVLECNEKIQDYLDIFNAHKNLVKSCQKTQSDAKNVEAKIAAFPKKLQSTLASIDKSYDSKLRKQIIANDRSIANVRARFVNYIIKKCSAKESAFRNPLLQLIDYVFGLSDFLSTIKCTLSKSYYRTALSYSDALQRAARNNANRLQKLELSRAARKQRAIDGNARDVALWTAKLNSMRARAADYAERMTNYKDAGTSIRGAAITCCTEIRKNSSQCQLASQTLTSCTIS